MLHHSRLREDRRRVQGRTNAQETSNSPGLGRLPSERRWWYLQCSADDSVKHVTFNNSTCIDTSSTVPTTVSSAIRSTAV